MTIKFNWDTGWMEMKVAYVIESMTMTNFKKWAKLFIQYGTPEQHKEFLERLDIYIGCEKKATCLKRYKRLREIWEGLVS